MKENLPTVHRLERIRESPQLRSVRSLSKLTDKIRKSLDGRNADLVCDTCALALDLLVQMINDNMTNEEIIDDVTELCVSLGIEIESVCRGMLEEAIVSTFVLQWNNCSTL